MHRADVEEDDVARVDLGQLPPLGGVELRRVLARNLRAGPFAMHPALRGRDRTSESLAGLSKPRKRWVCGCTARMPSVMRTWPSPIQHV